MMCDNSRCHPQPETQTIILRAWEKIQDQIDDVKNTAEAKWEIEASLSAAGCDVFSKNEFDSHPPRQYPPWGAYSNKVAHQNWFRRCMALTT